VVAVALAMAMAEAMAAGPTPARPTRRRSVLASLLALAGCSAEGAPPEDLGTDDAALGTGFICNGADVEAGHGDGTPSEEYGPSTFAAVRSAGRPEAGFDRFVLEFAPGSKVTRYLVQTQDTSTFPVGESDDTVTLAGTAGISITVWLGGSWADVIPSPPRFTVPNGKAILEADMNYLFEGDMGWALGLAKHNACYRVAKLANPPRLVVDVKR
jgi:hypothetical protein